MVDVITMPDVASDALEVRLTLTVEDVGTEDRRRILDAIYDSFGEAAREAVADGLIHDYRWGPVEGAGS